MNINEIRKSYEELKNSGEIQTIYSGNYIDNEDIINGKKIAYKVNKHSEGLENDDIKNLIEQNKNAIILKLLSDAGKLNKGKKVALKKFIGNYISKLTILEEQELLSKILYYLDFYELHNFGGSDKLDDEIIENHNLFSKGEILFELLYYNSILPEYTNQKQFNEDMDNFLSRLENSISGIKENTTPINFVPINPSTVWNYMDDMSTYSIFGSKKINKGIIKNISYKFHLGQKIDINELNEFSFSFLVEDSIISREEFLRYLKHILKLQNIGNNEYIYGSDNNFGFSIYVKENFYKDSPNKKLEEIQNFKGDFESIGFEFSIYANSKKDLEPEDELANACYSLPRVSESILNDLFSTYKNDKSDIYPEKKEYFDLVNYLNFNENHTDNVVDSDDFLPLGKGFDFNFGNKTIQKNNLSIEKVSLDDLIINDKLKAELERLIKFYKNRDFFINNGGSIPTGILLYGLPGGGKTTIAKILAGESNSGFYIVEPNIQGEYVGQSENNLKARFDEAKKHVDKTGQNSIIFIDEAENLFPKRGDKDHKEGMLSVLLQEMDGIDSRYKGKITYVFATNRKDILDPALLNRVDKNLEIPMPSVSQLEQIIDLNIKNKMKIIKDKMYEKADIDIQLIAKKIEGKSGRFVKKLIENSHNIGLEKLLSNSNFIMSTEIILESIEFTETEEKNTDKKMGFKV